MYLCQTEVENIWAKNGAVVIDVVDSYDDCSIVGIVTIIHHHLQHLKCKD